MKQCFGLLLLLATTIFSFSSNAQEKNSLYRPSVPKNAADSSRIIEQRLVELALKGPRYRVSDYQNKINEYELKKTKSVLLNQIALSTNINGQTFSKQSSTTAPAVVYPKLTAGITIPLGTVFSRTEVKAAREQIKAGKDIQEQLARTIKREVLSLYLQYKSATAKITNLTSLVDDQTAISGQVDQQLKDGKISFEEYGTISQQNSASSNELIDLEVQRDLLKLQIEEMIGLPLEDVLSGRIKPELNK